MSGIDRRADVPLVEWSGLGVTELLPTGTVTLLLADVEGSTRLWQTQPDEMTAAVARLDRVLGEAVANRHGVRPVEQGEGDSFVVAFARASDAVACALDLQQAPLTPIRLRIGVHSGEVQLRDEGNYIGPTINRTARLRDLAHGGQTVLSGAAAELVAENLPTDAWVIELGAHPLRDLPLPQRVVQLCHPGLRNEFPPLRAAKSTALHGFPIQLTSFVGRSAQIGEVRTLVDGRRLVTLTGAGGAGKTRLATEIAALIAGEFRDGTHYVDLSAITDPGNVAVAAARALRLPDQPGRTTVDTIIGIVGDRRMLLVLDNCEHLLEATASLANELLGACPRLTVMATSREPIGVAGEVTFGVPSLSLADEAIELFTDRARRVRDDFGRANDNLATVTEICRRLDCMPLAIELAAARVRALSLEEILDGLHDRFRLLTGGARTAVRRQQTLRASVDWSHALLTAPERTLFRRLAVFLGGFDLDAVQVIAADTEVQRYQVIDELTLLVDKSLVVVENGSERTRYRLLETMRHYAQQKLAESGEVHDVRSRHRDHYASMAAELDAPTRGDHLRRLEQAEEEMDNLRSAFGWSLETRDIAGALELATSLMPVWLNRGQAREGLSWLEAGLAGEDGTGVPPAVHARALADKATLCSWTGGSSSGTDDAERALAIARTLDDPALSIRALVARGVITGYDAATAAPYFTEASRLAREVGDSWRLSQILGWQTRAWHAGGDPAALAAAAEEGFVLATAIGDRDTARHCRAALGWVRSWRGRLSEALELLTEAVAESAAAHDGLQQFISLTVQGFCHAYVGDAGRAAASAEAAFGCLGGLHALEGLGYTITGIACQAAGDATAARQAYAEARRRTGMDPQLAGCFPQSALAPLGCGDLDEARSWADEVVSISYGCVVSVALTSRARVALARGDLAQAERDSRDALTCSTAHQTIFGVSDTLECLAEVAAAKGSGREAARLLGAADAARQRTGEVRLKTLDASHEAMAADLRDVLGGEDFAAAWAEGEALSTEAAIAYAQRGRGERKRPAAGWNALTPTERDVVRLVQEGLSNKEIGAQLFISPRTVQAHLTHVYAKLGVPSRLQLIQEAARHT